MDCVIVRLGLSILNLEKLKISENLVEKNQPYYFTQSGRHKNILNNFPNFRMRMNEKVQNQTIWAVNGGESREPKKILEMYNGKNINR